MSRKDYIIIAAAVAQARQATNIQHNTAKRRAGEDGIRLTAIGLASHLSQDNPLFDRGRFMSACGF